MSNVGVVIIGRNEGDRLRICLESALNSNCPVVYVDSGSTDGSIELAKGKGSGVVELHMSRPFTAARARNAGFERLMADHPATAFVQFVDGDCELAAGWIDAGRRALEGDAGLAAVAGRLRERFPERSVYNALCQMEWDVPPGEAKAAGGIAMFRCAALSQVGGFNAVLPAGEEPELCLRLRRAGYRFLRLADEMALHDAAIFRFSQWWKRAVRSGYAYAMGQDMHGHESERYCVSDSRRIWGWGVLLPLISLAAAVPTRGWSLLLFLLYIVQFVRIARWAKRRGWSARHARIYAFFNLIAKFPQVQGQIRYRLNRARQRSHTIIEYKAAPAQNNSATPPS